MSERHACRLLGLGRSTHRYRARKAERDAALRMRLKELAAKRMRFGYRRLTAMLVREGMSANHKRVYRLYREEGLAMRIRQRRRIRWNGAVVKPAASQPNERWSMDFVSDCVSSGKVIRMLTIVDDCTRECPVDRGRYLAGRIACAVECWIGWRSSADCRKRLFWTTGRSFAAGHWQPGAKNVGCDWSSFSRASRCRMPTSKASTDDCATNV